MPERSETLKSRRNYVCHLLSCIAACWRKTPSNLLSQITTSRTPRRGRQTSGPQVRRCQRLRLSRLARCQAGRLWQRHEFEVVKDGMKIDSGGLFELYLGAFEDKIAFALGVS